ncbi:MAG: tail fiber domain-containing protein [Betaproteobacteria bacterium]|nr:tail fiber domain-containing protein [Betaproteobacteria bacterium]
MSLHGGTTDAGNQPFPRNLNNTLNTALTNQPVDPILQAAQIQSEALTQGQELFQPFLQAGTQGLDFLTQAGTAGGLDEILRMIFSGESFGGLRDERRRGVEGALGAGGLTRSGVAIEEGANISSDLGLQLLQLLTGTNTGLAQGGFGAATNIAELMGRSAEATASGILGLEERSQTRRADRSNRTTELFGAVLGGLFSDPRLKENIKEIGNFGKLKLYTWNWKPEFKDTIVATFPTTGVLSTDVREVYPDLVSEFGSYDVINYKGLIERLQWH